VQRIVNAARQLCSDSRNRPEDLPRVEPAPLAFEPTPAARSQHLRDRGGDSRTDARQRHKSFGSLALEEFAEIFCKARDRVCGLPVGAHPKWIRLLLLEEIADLAQLLGDELVHRLGHGGSRASAPDRRARLLAQGWP